MLRYASPARGVLTSIGILLLAVLFASFAVVPAAIFDTTILTDPYGATRDALVVFMVLNFVAFVIAGAVYMQITGRGWTFIDLQMPGRRDVIWMGGGILLVLVFYFALSIAATLLELPAADNDIVLMLGDDVTMVLIMIGIVLFFNAPAEEFLFRNVIQKRLYDSFSGVGAVILTSILFALVHFTSYIMAAESIVATAVSLVVMFGGSIIMGYAYLRTRNLWVPIVIHAGMNVFMLVIYLLSIVYDIDQEVNGAVLSLFG